MLPRRFFHETARGRRSKLVDFEGSAQSHFSGEIVERELLFPRVNRAVADRAAAVGGGEMRAVVAKKTQGEAVEVAGLDRVELHRTAAGFGQVAAIGLLQAFGKRR